MNNKEQVLQQVEQQEKLIEAKVKDWISKLTNKTINVYTRCSWWGGESGNYFKADVEFIKEDGKKDFGSSFTIEIYDKQLQLNAGYCGSITKDKIYQIERAHIMSKILANIEEYEKELIELTQHKCFYELNQIEYKEQCEKWKKQEQEREEKKQEALKGLKVGSWYISKDQKCKYEVYKITPKRVYVTYYFHSWKSTQDNIIWDMWGQKYFGKDMFVSEIVDGFKNKIEE